MFGVFDQGRNRGLLDFLVLAVKLLDLELLPVGLAPNFELPLVVEALLEALRGLEKAEFGNCRNRRVGSGLGEGEGAQEGGFWLVFERRNLDFPRMRLFFSDFQAVLYIVVLDYHLLDLLFVLPDMRLGEVARGVRPGLRRPHANFFHFSVLNLPLGLVMREEVSSADRKVDIGVH